MKVSVYLGSSATCLPEYNQLAFEVGRIICAKGHTLVYGGADVGTMKFLADGASSVQGKIIGVFPEGFKGTIEVQREGIKVQREGLGEMVMTRDFAERKQVMEDMSDCCIVLPGSYGTLDELFTYACNRTIGKNEKRIIVYNHKGFYDPLKALVGNINKAGLLKPSAQGILTFVDSMGELESYL